MRLPRPHCVLGGDFWGRWATWGQRPRALLLCHSAARPQVGGCVGRAAVVLRRFAAETQCKVASLLTWGHRPQALFLGRFAAEAGRWAAIGMRVAFGCNGKTFSVPRSGRGMQPGVCDPRFVNARSTLSYSSAPKGGAGGRLRVSRAVQNGGQKVAKK